MTPLPSMSDDKFCEVIEILVDAAAVADSIDWVLKVEDDDPSLVSRVENVRRLSFGLQRTLEMCSRELNEIHREWLRQYLVAQRAEQNSKRPEQASPP